jgi:serine acetyltransferase
MIMLLNPVFLSRFQNRFIRFFNHLVNGCNINTKLPASTCLEHRGLGIVIGLGVKLGENVHIYQNTTIGGKDMIGENIYPVIEDNVRIGANSVIVGPIRIGRNTPIGAGSFIDKDIPADSVAYNPRTLCVKSKKE